MLEFFLFLLSGPYCALGSLQQTAEAVEVQGDSFAAWMVKIWATGEKFVPAVGSNKLEHLRYAALNGPTYTPTLPTRYHNHRFGAISGSNGGSILLGGPYHS